MYYMRLILQGLMFAVVHSWTIITRLCNTIIYNFVQCQMITMQTVYVVIIASDYMQHSKGTCCAPSGFEAL